MSLASLCVLGLAASGIQSPAWTLSPSHSLIWEGRNYSPVGARITGSAAEVQNAADKGISDVLVELPSDGTGWTPVIEALNRTNLRYMIVFTSAAPAAQVYAVQPQGYRRQGLVNDFKLDFSMPSAESVFCVLAARRDGVVRWSERIPVKNGRLNIQTTAGGFEQTLLMYPVQTDLSVTDFWEGFDRHRDTLLRSLKAQTFGTNFRGIINPLGTVIGFPGDEVDAIPTSPLFVLELEQLLKERHGSFRGALTAWRVGTNDIPDVRRLAGLVPLWSSGRGVQNYWDPTTDKIYGLTGPNSTAWTDIRDALRAIMNRRVERLIAGIRQVVNVPVVQEFRGWNGPYQSNSAGWTGLSFKGSGRIIDVIDAASRPAAQALSWEKPSSLWAEDIIMSPGIKGKVSDLVNESESLGVRGWFFRPNAPEDWAEIAAIAKRRESMEEAARPSHLPYPEAARNPCFPTRIFGSRWWLPSPGEGNRVDLGSEIQGYTYRKAGLNFAAYWSRKGLIRVSFKARDPKKVIFEPLDGSDLKPKIKKSEVEINLGTVPVIVRSEGDFPAPTVSFAQVGEDSRKLLRLFEDLDPGENMFAFMEAIRSWDRSPFDAMQRMGDVRRNSARIAGPFVWVEAEAMPLHNFSEIGDEPGASSGRVLILDTRLPSPADGFRASFNVKTKVAGSHEVWISGQVPDRLRSFLTVSLAGRQLTIADQGIGIYARGLMWYRLGTLDLPKTTIPAALRIDAPNGARLKLDAIVFTPVPFQPSAVDVPLEWLASVKIGPEKGSGGLSVLPPIPPASAPR